MIDIKTLKYLNILSLIIVILTILIYSNPAFVVNFFGFRNDCQYVNTYSKIHKDLFINDPIPGELCSWLLDTEIKIGIIFSAIYFLLNILIMKELSKKLKQIKREHIALTFLCGFAGIYYSQIETN